MLVPTPSGGRRAVSDRSTGCEYRERKRYPCCIPGDRL